MSFGTTFVDGAAEMEDAGEHEEITAEVVDGLTGVEPLVADPSLPWNKPFDSRARMEAHAAGKAHAAYASAGAGSYPDSPRRMNVVVTFGDAARTFAYRGINALARKLDEIAERIALSR